MKVVINRCYGGFGLSPLATKRLAELNGRECYFYKDAHGSFASNKLVKVSTDEAEREIFWYAYDVPNADELDDIGRDGHYIYYDSSTDRSDEKLIKVVEELGKKANGSCASLEIVEIPDGVEYVIDDYDGIETIHEKHRSWP